MMGLVGGGGDCAAFYLGFLVCTTVLTFCQGVQYEHPAQYRYPFIRPASSFSPPPPSSAASSTAAAAYDYIIVGEARRDAHSPPHSPPKLHRFAAGERWDPFRERECVVHAEFPHHAGGHIADVGVADVHLHRWGVQF
ncbi:protein hothead [Phtheirospermum japonicum]|uniref:Protein hothead n=1 Tax=Phtheirospermum japonicum TaxID=374723 RepID=A0A830BWL1_9LAMI|nr:protein hothead [Phtheirospermum japonicum]